MSSTATLTAATVMQAAAALLNDVARSVYTYAIQVPYLNMAVQELQEFFELNNIPVTDTVTGVVINIPTGDIRIAFDNGVNPSLPDDFIEPKVLWESPEDTDTWTPMIRQDFLPRYMEGTEISQFIVYTWQSQEIRFLPANQDNDIKMDYIRRIFTPVVDENSTLNVVNAQSYLEYRTAALVAEFVAENPTRASSLNSDASISLDRVIGIGTKGRQAITVRRRPFRSGYKRGTWM